MLLDALAATAAVLLIAAPLLFTDSGFSLDFTNHLWLAWVAGKALVQAGHPVYFLNTSAGGIFDPWFAFYGGTLYVVTGGVSQLLGDHPIVAFASVTVLAIAGTYCGMLWLGRQLGLTRWSSHVPALVVITSAYYVTDLYGRGAWPEFIAISAISPLLAGGFYLVRTPRWRPGPILIFIASVVLFTGSHNITLLWGATVGVLASGISWLTLQRPRQLPLRRVLQTAALGLTCTGVNAWFLIPDLRYASNVQIFAGTHSGAGGGFFDLPQVLFYPLRLVPRQSTTPALFVQAPDWFLAWALITGAVLLWRRPPTDRLRRGWLAIMVFTVVLLGLIGMTPLWNWIPAPFSDIQFPYRLNSYLFYGVSALVLVACLALQRASSERDSRHLAMSAALVAAGAISIALCIWQLWVPSTLSPGVSYGRRQEALRSVNLLPRTWYTRNNYNDARAPIVDVPQSRALIIDPSQVRGDHFSALLQVPPGMAPIQTNISGGSYLVRLVGLTLLGRNPEGYAVVRRTTDGNGPVHVVIETASSATVSLADLVSLASCAMLAVFFFGVCIVGHRSR